MENLRNMLLQDCGQGNLDQVLKISDEMEEDNNSEESEESNSEEGSIGKVVLEEVSKMIQPVAASITELTNSVAEVNAKVEKLASDNSAEEGQEEEIPEDAEFEEEEEIPEEDAEEPFTDSQSRQVKFLVNKRVFDVLSKVKVKKIRSKRTFDSLTALKHKGKTYLAFKNVIIPMV